MLVCNVSLRPPRRAIAVDIAEVLAATDATATGNIVFATLVDDPASVADFVDAYSGEIMLEAASASDSSSVLNIIAAAVDETMTTSDTLDAELALPLATWNPAGTSAGMTLSNGNLTASRPYFTGDQYTRSSTAKSSGKVYCEVTSVAAGGSGHDQIGLITASANISSWLNNATGGIWFALNGSAWFNGSAASAGAGSYGSGAVVCFAVDLVNSRVWARVNGGNWNNSGSNNPTTNVGGIDISALFPTNAAYMCFASTGQWSASDRTINFGATTFAQSVPSGFTAWG